MASMLSLCLLTFYSVGFSKAWVLPVDKCKLEDSACMQTAVQKAIPAFIAGLPDQAVDVLDPMKLEKIVVDLYGLKFILKDGELTGQKGITVDSVKWDSDKKKIIMDYHLDCTIKGNYKASGKVLILPITGDGVLTMEMKNFALKLTMDYKLEKKDGKEYVVPTKYDFSAEMKDGLHFDMTNLFNGNKILSEGMLKFLNENWQQVYQKFGKVVTDAIVKIVFKNIVNFLGKVPNDDLALA